MKTLKSIVAAVTLGVVLGSSLSAPAALTVTDFSNGGSGTLYTGGSSSGSQVIPDNTPDGVGYSFNFTDPAASSISDISVTLDLTGGYNNDIYAYLSHGSTLVVLVDQITGTAGTGSGFNNVVLNEGTGGTIQSGTYTADQNLAGFNGANPNGSWTIFFADRNPGDTSTLTGFSVNLTAVPEPVNVALGVFGGLFAVVGLVRIVRRMKAA